MTILDRRLTPGALLIEGGAPPWWTQHVDLVLELGVSVQQAGGSVGVWGTGQWDNTPPDIWSGLEPDWLEVDPCNLLDVGLDRGRDRWTDRFGASSASFSVQDPDGNLSWDADDADDQLAVRPGREVRLTATVLGDGSTHAMWRGWIETIDDDFTPAAVPVAKFTAQDGYAQLAHINFGEGPIVGTGESSDERIHRLLDLAGWPADRRDIDLGAITVQGTNLARAVADDLGITADSEGGAVFSDREDRIAFRARDWLRTDPRATELQATIGGPLQDVCAASFVATRSAGDIVNDVQVARAGGTMQRFIDNTSIALYNHRTYSRSDYVCEDDEQVAVLGTRILKSRAGGHVRLPSLRITPTDNPVEWRFVCEVDYGWRVEVHYPTLDGTDWVRTVIVQGIAHDISPDGWETVLRVDDVSALIFAADVWDGPRGWDLATWSEVA